MKKYVIVALVASVIISCSQQKENVQELKFDYPKTAKGEVSDNYFGIEVSDPYRWLENDTSIETKNWVTEQNKVTFAYLNEIPFKEKIKNRLTEIINYPKQSAPFKKGDMYFYYKNTGLQNQSLLYATDDYTKEGTVLLDPNSFSDDGTVALSSMDISKNGKYIAYSISRGGSDWKEIYVKNIETGEMEEDHLEWVKFSGISWHKDGFYYSGYDAPKKGTELSTKNEFHKLYFHKLGTPQTEDIIVMENKELPLRMFYGSTTDDENYLIIYEENVGSRGAKIYYVDLSTEDKKAIALTDNFDFEYGILANYDNKLIFQTNINAPKSKLISIDLTDISQENWKDIIPESEYVMKSVSYVNNKFIVKYMKDAHNILQVFSLDGKLINDIKMPTICSVGGFSGNKDDKIGFYTISSFIFPSTVYKYDFETQKSEIIFKPEVDFDDTQYETKQIFFASKDGTKIPMFIVHKKEIELDGNHPTLLYGYGGFNVSITPSFSASRLIWLENNGVVAIATLRGGGEYGQDWHEAGMRLNKQNVFDDFIAAGEYLISEKYTASSKLTIQGGSNGGLLVGAVTNQRPDLMAVSLPAVGVMDMLRYQHFTIGWNWVTDYGSSEDSTQFDNLFGISPIHNITADKNYPAVLVTTADHDDRVVPAHSFKYISTLQEHYKGNNPVMIRIGVDAGHGAGKPISKTIEEYADLWSFAFYNMGVVPVYE